MLTDGSIRVKIVFMREPTKKLEVPSGCDTDEFTRFNTLLRDVLKVPKKEIQERERKTTKKTVRKTT